MSPLELVQHIRQFFDIHAPSCPFVFGCSGGVDSTALLHLLHEAECRNGHIVHVDHGWRAESADEAKVLSQKAASLGWPCTIVRLGKAPSGVNIEDWCRSERMAAFRSVASSLGSDVVVLAHQADDQAEVIMKRFFEGASLLKFRGMRSVERRDGLTILRPLIAVRRADLLNFLHDKDISYFVDPTNSDTSFLRARMRVDMVPALERSFGKNVANSLLRVAEESADLEAFVQEECGRRFSIKSLPGASFVSSSEEVSPFLVRAVVEKIREQLVLSSPSRAVVEGIVRTFCADPSGARSFPVGEGGFFVESRSIAAFQKKPAPIKDVFCNGDRGQLQTGSWNISWRPSVVPPQSSPDWFSLFAKKAASWYIPDQPFRICRVSDRLQRARERRLVALRPFVPAVAQAFALVVDPLSGYTVALEQGSRCIEVTVQFSI